MREIRTKTHIDAPAERVWDVLPTWPRTASGTPPTDGLWRGAMRAFQDPSALLRFGGSDAEAFPFLSAAPLMLTYLAWAAVWVAMVWGLAAGSLQRKDL